MKTTNNSIVNYLTITENNEKWGTVCTTVGYQDVLPNSKYPVSQHPTNYNFTYKLGRTLNEYQLVYITSGEGLFESASYPRSIVKSGTMILLFPGEWHSYSPSKETGWTEWWVGFKGGHIDNIIKGGFFTKKEPLLYIGNSIGIESLYQEIIKEAQNEYSNFQILISGIIHHILGSIVYKKSSIYHSNNPISDKINEAKLIMRNNIATNITAADIAYQLHISYSLFRHAFKEYVGTSPSQYMQQVKHNKAKELLSTTDIPISDIAFQLNFGNICQFSTFFKRHEGMSAREYRAKNNPLLNQIFYEK